VFALLAVLRDLADGTRSQSQMCGLEVDFADTVATATSLNWGIKKLASDRRSSAATVLPTMQTG